MSRRKERRDALMAAVDALSRASVFLDALRRGAVGPDFERDLEATDNAAQTAVRKGFDALNEKRLVNPGLRAFHLQRQDDETGVSGTGKVAEGVVFTDGTVVMRWLTETRTTAMYDRIDDVIEIHGHDGKTKVVFDSVPCGPCICGAYGEEPIGCIQHGFCAAHLSRISVDDAREVTHGS